MSASKIFLNYTDWHDVDENMKSVTVVNGHWINDSSLGIFMRGVNDIPTNVWVHVASIQ